MFSGCHVGRRRRGRLCVLGVDGAVRQSVVALVGLFVVHDEGAHTVL